jgi:hypothetical protein
MAEQDPTKRGQVTGMNQNHSIETSQETHPRASHSPGAVDQDQAADSLSGSASTSGAVMEPDLQAHIGRQLRQVYEEVVNEAVPDRFLKLLEDLERGRGGQS